MAAFLVDDGTLFVHDVVIFEQALTDAEVVFFHFLLRPLDARINHRRFDHLALFEAQLVHDVGDAFRGEQAHEVVFERDEENG